MIASVVGISHDRLIVFHNWIGWTMFALALVHTFSFVIFHFWKGDMTTVYETSVVYWTGIVPLVVQFYLQVMSLPSIRDRYYEFFRATHYIAAVAFVVFFFLHCDFRLSSWNYFIATGVIYTLSWLYPQIRTYFKHGLSCKARFEMMSDACMRITIPIDTTWQPTQHVFLRFITLSVHSLTAHPFTICSTPNPRGRSQDTKMIFYIQPRGGLTGRLAKLASQQPGWTVPVLIDGPYGGLHGKSLHSSDHSLVIACGSGAALPLGLIMDIINRSNYRPEIGDDTTPHHMEVVIATRDPGFVEWFNQTLLSFLDERDFSLPPEILKISMYQTSHPESDRHEVSSNAEKDGLVEVTHPRKPSPEPKQLPIQIFSGRPDIRTLVRQSTLKHDISLGIVACGPGGLLQEVQDEAASAQLRILSSKPGAREVYLHSELFSW
ncbi:ferric reductase transmembrane [Seiridium cupressi]